MRLQKQSKKPIEKSIEMPTRVFLKQIYLKPRKLAKYLFLAEILKFFSLSQFLEFNRRSLSIENIPKGCNAYSVKHGFKLILILN